MIHKKLTLGVAIGGISRTYNPHEAIHLVREAGYTAIELSDKNKSAPLIIAEGDLAGFSYVSFHAPILPYGNNQETQEAFRALEAIHAVRPLNLAVFHPNTVENFSVFHRLPFPVGFENMDWRKPSHRTVEDMKRVMEYDSRFKFVLDINHIYTNDNTLAPVEDFYRAFSSRLAEIHVSGFKALHEPLFKTQQEHFIQLIRDSSVPIILEGVGKVEELAPEREYVLQKIEKMFAAR